MINDKLLRRGFCRLIRRHKSLQVNIKGYSMYPLFNPSDIVAISSVNRDFKVGDIIVFFTSTNKLIIHRIVFIYGNTILTKGDNNFWIDPVISHDQVIAVCTYFKKTETIDKLIASISLVNGLIFKLSLRLSGNDVVASLLYRSMNGLRNVNRKLIKHRKKCFIPNFSL